MSEIKRVEKAAVFDYDAQSDVLYVYLEGVKYLESVDFGDIILDIGENNILKGIVILDASKKFKVNKYDLKHVQKLSAEIRTTPDIIKLKITVSILKRNKEIEKYATARGLNDVSLPTGIVCMEC